MNEWRTSSYSTGANECVEVRRAAAGTDMRDSKARGLGHLGVASDEWVAFLASLRLDVRGLEEGMRP